MSEKGDTAVPEPLLRVELFRGGRLVFADGRIVERYDRRTTLLLLAYLALFQQRIHTRDELTDLLWPDLNPANARNSLNVALSSLRALVRDALHTDRHHVQLKAATDVLELERTRNPDHYTGSLLSGYDLPWLNLERLRLETLALHLLEARGAEADCRRLLTLDPTNETVLRSLLTHLRSEGRTQELLPLYDVSVKALAELGLEPDPETTALVADLRRKKRKKRMTPLRRVLPDWPDPFFGRQEEIGRIDALLDSGARLITITGPGGMGKTRLAVEFARTRANRDVYFVPLATTTTTEEAGEAILQALNTPREPATSLWHQLHVRLARTPTLLILDNYEQLPPVAGSRIAQLAGSTPKLICLITSRRRLEVQGEQEAALEPLSSAHAVGLFLQRARIVRPGFSADTRTLERIVGMVDRMPLALEMAAARALILGGEEILTGLSDCLAFLRTRRVDVEERRRSIEATLTWSWNLLTPELRTVLAYLSIFRGGFTLQAAEAVCGKTPSVLYALEVLRANSLLVVARDLPRFHLLETIRAFAQEHLTEQELTAGRGRHGVYYTERLERGESCREERENLRAASVWFTEARDAREHLRFIAAFCVHHWEEAFSENIDHCRPALALATEGNLPPQLRGRALAAYALVSERVEQSSTDTFRRAAELLEDSREDEPLRAFVLQYAGTPEYREQAEQVARRAGDDRTLYWVLTIQGNHASNRGDWDCAEQYWTEALATALRIGERRHADFMRSEWSFYLSRRGEYVRSLALLQEVPNFERLGNWNYPRLLMALGRYDLARNMALRNVEYYERLGASRLVQIVYVVLATTHLCLGDGEAAQKACVRAESAAGVPQYRLRSEIALACGEVETAVHCARSGLALVPPRVHDFHTGGERVGLLEALARAEACSGRAQEAWNALLEAMELRFRFGVYQQQCENLETAAYIEAQAGQFAAAAQSLRAAEGARLERSNPCPPPLRRFAAEARRRIPAALLSDALCLPLDAAIEKILT